MRKLLTLLFGCLLLSTLHSLPASAGARPTIFLEATRTAVLSDGVDVTELIARVRGSNGNFVNDGTNVTFTTTLGLFQRAGSSATVQTRAGVARVQLTSLQKGTATISAAVDGGGLQSMSILFTDNPEETFQGNTFVEMTGTSTLYYAANEGILEAIGRTRTDRERDKGGARLVYRNIEITADQLQLATTTYNHQPGEVRATGGVLLKRGAKVVKFNRLSYNITTGFGFGITQFEGRVQPVQVSGPELKLEKVASNATAEQLQTVPELLRVRADLIKLDDLSDAKLVVTAKQILIFLNEKLQFKRPTFYQDGTKLVSMAFYTIPFNSRQLFTDQFVSVGSNGLAVDIPVYYDMTPSSMGVFRVRYGERIGSSVFATRPGLSLDLAQTYTSTGTRRFNGEFGVTGMNRNDWGMRWNHSQEFTRATRGSFYVDFPQHQAIFASTNMNHQTSLFNLGFNVTGNTSILGPNSTGFNGSAYAETLPRKVGRTGYMMALGTNASATRTKIGQFQNSVSTQAVQMRFFNNPFRLDRSTTLSNNLSVGQQWSSNGINGVNTTASLGLTRMFAGSNMLQINYDFTHQPSMVLTDTNGRHRVSAVFSANAGTKWSFFANANTFLDVNSRNLSSSLRYNFARRWNFYTNASVQQFAGTNFNDLEVGVSRSIGGRDLNVSYSTLNRRVFFSLEAGRF